MSARPQPVFYRQEDYVGVMSRLVIDLVDALVAVFASLILTLLVVALLQGQFIAYPISFFAWILVFYLYFVVWKGSRFRTLGYVILGARIVSLSSQRPSHAALIGRLAFAVFGPANFLVDLLWVSSDPCGQALRDKFAHTYVVRNGAVPAGNGRLAYRVYMIFGMTLLFAEVLPDAS